ncbi:MAG: LysM peptidoglycan-binding domain-containing protein [Verrucomicrobiia bacterium]
MRDVFSKITRIILTIVVVVVLSGCYPSEYDQLNEQRDPHFLAGKAYLNTFNYRAAAEEFEKALESNPRSASAHFELGLLYEQKLAIENAPAIAIYHFDKFLQLRPNSEYAPIVRQKILACKREIAKPFAVDPGAQSYLREYERLKAENAQLKSQIELWQVYYSNLMARAQSVIVSQPQTVQPSAQKEPSATANVVAKIPPAPIITQPPQKTYESTTKYTVKAGDTMAAIAKRYGISLNSLTAANPGVDPRRLKVGQTLNIPVKENTSR